MSAPVAVLCCRRDSIYKSLRCDPWDADRDARAWPGGVPLVAHPPCRSWGRLRKFASPAAGERDLARLTVAQVRQWGGVLEHPEASTLWQDQDMPRPGAGADAWGVWTLAVNQFWWGHRSRKATWLYIVGVGPRDLPNIPFAMGDAPCVVSRSGRRGKRLLISKAEREHTPEAFARWLLAVAERVAR